MGHRPPILLYRVLISFVTLPQINLPEQLRQSAQPKGGFIDSKKWLFLVIFSKLKVILLGIADSN
jgi:hypothetical protein